MLLSVVGIDEFRMRSVGMDPLTAKGCFGREDGTGCDRVLPLRKREAMDLAGSIIFRLLSWVLTCGDGILGLTGLWGFMHKIDAFVRVVSYFFQ